MAVPWVASGSIHRDLRLTNPISGEIPLRVFRVSANRSGIPAGLMAGTLGWVVPFWGVTERSEPKPGILFP